MNDRLPAHELPHGVQPGDEAKKPAVTIKKGANGILNADTEIKIGGKETPVKKGTVVKVSEVEGDRIQVKLQSGLKGEEAEIASSLFQAEPGVAKDEITGKPRDDVYEEYEAALWGPNGPTVGDVAQGYIDDCFLMAGMGAVVVKNPGAIKALFEPQTPGAKSYNVTLYKKGKDKKLNPVQISVDTQLPTQKGTGHTPAYGDNGMTGDGLALWPALVEKAYATLVGGYAAADEGGMPGDAMQALTGVESGSRGIHGPKTVIELFKSFENEGKAVVAGTLSEMKAEKQHPFEGVGGNFRATLQTNEGLKAEIVQSSLEITDTKSEHHTHAKDDGKGAIKGADLASGTIAYNSGNAELKFKEGKAPEKAANLEVAYQYRGMISKELGVYADHSYIFERVEGNQLIFKNPWGYSHPKPIGAAEFAKLFDLLDTNQATPNEGK